MAILAYQILIFCLIVGATLMFGRKGQLIATTLAAVWTITQVFLPWLIFLQFVTVGLAYLTGNGILWASSNRATLRDN